MDDNLVFVPFESAEEAKKWLFDNHYGLWALFSKGGIWEEWGDEGVKEYADALRYHIAEHDKAVRQAQEEEELTFSGSRLHRVVGCML